MSYVGTIDYTSDAQKLKNFPGTLKGTSLRSLMELGSAIIGTWGEMKTTFL